MTHVIKADGRPLTVRPVDRSDIEQLDRMLARLSRKSIYFRFFSPLPRVPDALLHRIVEVDHRRRDALVVLDGADVVALASYGESAGPHPCSERDAEIALVVDDAWQRRGIGAHLAQALARLAFERGYETLVARILPTNRAALGLIRKLSPDATVRLTNGEYEARLTVDDVAPSSRACSAHRSSPRRSGVTGDLAAPASASLIGTGGTS